ncbi:hypothetical protein [Cupriavidus sp. AU9028]|uniref:hypothetical protein n=1 Tax=Cupriavidus sp. AU9028 TaxID=2871157 RepID=UPI00210631F4|nr:hypothetical protein [Cupriavidus sp. AU9028]
MPSRLRRRLHALAIWLVLSLLAAQCAGLIHRVRHAGGEAAAQQPLVLKAGAGAAVGTSHAVAGRPLIRADDGTGHAALQHAGHSCVLFDAAAMADAHCTLPSPLALSHERPRLPLALDWRWPHLPPARPFLTRAPPAAGLAA